MNSFCVPAFSEEDISHVDGGEQEPTAALWSARLH